MDKKVEKEIHDIVKLLSRKGLENPIPDSSICLELLQRLEKESNNMIKIISNNIHILKKTTKQNGESSATTAATIMTTKRMTRSSSTSIIGYVDVQSRKMVLELMSKGHRSFKRQYQKTIATTTTTTPMNEQNNRKKQEAQEWIMAMKHCDTIRNIWNGNSAKDQSENVVKSIVGTKINNQKGNKTTKAKEGNQATGEVSSSIDNYHHVRLHNLPKTVKEYRNRLVKHDKQLFKDPPVLPPMNIQIESVTCPLPNRCTRTGQLSFTAANTNTKNDDDDDDITTLLKDFHPNVTPEEVLRAGAFGGTYFRPITSSVTNIKYNSDDVLADTIEQSWIGGLSKETHVTSVIYRKEINKYNVKCGGSLGMWESSGWITEVDPYGWFQWYCKFYLGRRTSDDRRQISRWLKSVGPKGRFRSQLCNKIILHSKQRTSSSLSSSCHDKTISPVLRQVLLHWGLEITPTILENHKKRIEKKG